MARGGDTFQNTPRVVRHGTKHDRHLRLDDAALLGGDLGNRRTEPITMVKTDASDDTDLRPLHKIGRVKPPTQPGLQNQVVNLLPPVQLKCRRRQKLEVGEVGW